MTQRAMDEKARKRREAEEAERKQGRAFRAAQELDEQIQAYHAMRLKGTEYELSRQELVGWLQHHIAEQKRIDTATSGAPIISESVSGLPPTKDTPVSSDVQLLLPVDIKKQRRQVKQLFLDQAFETGTQIKSAVQSGMPTLAVDVAPAIFDAMVKSQGWITDEDSWKPIAAAFPTQHSAYAQQLREAVLKRKSEGHPFILLFAVREERVQLLTLS